ncbi:hypothetical protein QCA50_007972 [Cerrena zonata]|uniref:Uncharacterized protein n=1 Tax=Cerrena zonata TaxID=2478898 RepID=A0AAW0GEL0_9APHY
MRLTLDVLPSELAPILPPSSPPAVPQIWSPEADWYNHSSISARPSDSPTPQAARSAEGYTKVAASDLWAL